MLDSRLQNLFLKFLVLAAILSPLATRGLFLCQMDTFLYLHVGYIYHVEAYFTFEEPR